MKSQTQFNRRNKKVFKHGPTSYWMHDPKIIFDELNLKKGDSFLDLGCGSGDYAIHASKIVGNFGMVYAIDKEKNILNDLEKKLTSKGITNVKVSVVDIIKKLPLNDNSIDVCLMATVLHTLGLKKQTPFREVKRVLKPGGRLITIDCKKEDVDFGPPLQMRLSPEEIENFVTPYGFKKIKIIDLGHNYMIQFVSLENL